MWVQSLGWEDPLEKKMATDIHKPVTNKLLKLCAYEKHLGPQAGVRTVLRTVNNLIVIDPTLWTKQSNLQIDKNENGL